MTKNDNGIPIETQITPPDGYRNGLDFHFNPDTNRVYLHAEYSGRFVIRVEYTIREFLFLLFGEDYKVTFEKNVK